MNLDQSINELVLERISRYLRPVEHADVVMSCPPVWIRAKDAEYFFGIKRYFLDKMVVEKKISIRKAEKMTLYRYADIAKYIEDMGK